ncbi:MAG: hypothetical protein IKJ67_09125 [Bacteroidales bacterium]|nr:hypothetical protein [Bacteroidales bacterium]
MSSELWAVSHEPERFYHIQPYGTALGYKRHKTTGKRHETKDKGRLSFDIRRLSLTLKPNHLSSFDFRHLSLRQPASTDL